MKHLHHQKSFLLFFLVSMYKMVDVSKKTDGNKSIEVVVDGIGTL